MSIHKKKKTVLSELGRNNGILRLLPAWVSRKLLLPGKRLKLAPKDLYAHGAKRGPIVERWMASTGMADNGVLTVENEGLSYIYLKKKNDKVLLKEAIEILGDKILGDHIMNKYGGLTAFAKFYDFARPLPHHLHLMEEDARLVGVTPKPESYYFPVQLNSINYRGDYTFFGLEPGVTKEDVISSLKKWDKGMNDILTLSKAYKLELGTGWNVPAGILHAPGSLVTYEPQKVSDTSVFMQSMVYDKYIDKELLTKFVPKDKENDYEYIADLIDWEANIDPEFKSHYFKEPLPVKEKRKMKEEGYIEEWISYGSEEFSAKKLTVLPGRKVSIKDSWGYGFIMMEGYGKINGVKIETPSIINFGEFSSDEMFVTIEAAKRGVNITNFSDHNDLVMLKHFGPESSPSIKE